MRRSLFKRGDIDFSSDDIHRFLPWLIAVMACLTTLLLSLSISIHGWIEGRHQNYAANFTVNVPAKVIDAATIDKITLVLTENDGIKLVERVRPEELQAVMQNWLGNADIGELPLPTVLEVTLKNNQVGAFDHAALQAQLSTITSGVEIDAHESWVQAFASFSQVTSLMLMALSLIIITAMAAAIIFAARTALKLHARTVSLLHSIGSEDIYITRQFQQDAVKTSLPGLVLGTGLAAGIYWASGAYLASLPASVIPPMAIQHGHIALFILLPTLCTVAASVVTRMAVLGQLRRTL